MSAIGRTRFMLDDLFCAPSFDTCAIPTLICRGVVNARTLITLSVVEAVSQTARVIRG